MQLTISRRSFQRVTKGSKDVWTSDAALEGGGTETDCTSDAAYASCLFMLDLNFHNESSIYSSQWFACLASHTSRSNPPVTHPSLFPLQLTISRQSFQPSDAALVGGGSEASGLATQIVWGVGAKTLAFDAALEGGGTETDFTSDAAYASCLFMLDLNFHSGSSIYSSEHDD
ncbi:hypothetical protein F2Q69_00014649 [Brassica cretica]|uniref:Uncharacterized protein n=1 Tax=Brassica cretica TaxID=69181 RepID=A0A8S9R595_BRACR|nr:hypothetical protein F2Q69_00014649 [Brassica cretica]